MTVIARSEATKQSRKATIKDRPLSTIIPEAPKDLKDKTRQDSHKDVNLVSPPKTNKGVNVLSLGVKDKTVGDSDGAWAGAREEDFDQSAGAVEEFDQTAGQDSDCAVDQAKGASKSKAKKKIDFTPPLHLADMWDDFLTVRKGRSAVPTQRAFEGIIRELEKLAPGDTEKQREILDQSIRLGYHDVYPLRDKTNNKQPQGKPLTSGRTIYEFERESIESGKYKNILPKA